MITYITTSPESRARNIVSLPQLKLVTFENLQHGPIQDRHVSKVRKTHLPLCVYGLDGDDAMVYMDMAYVHNKVALPDLL